MTHDPELLTTALLDYLDPGERALLEQILNRKRLWTPLPGPQTEAYVSDAEIIGYGGAAGGGKTDLAIGLALTQHRKVAIFRQNGTELTAIIDRFAEILGTRDGFNGQDRIWRLRRPDGVQVQIELGSFPNPKDEVKYQGRAHDLLVFDEASNMREEAVRFLFGWLRDPDRTQRCRALLCFNPPTTAEGRWITSYFGPWLDKAYDNPAVPGEIRWFVRLDNADREVPGPEPVEHDGKILNPVSRTFVASRVTDNPYFAGTAYEARLLALPEPLRSQMYYGDFTAGVEDDPYQVIPTSWVEAAMARWTRPTILPEMDSVGVDVALGGDDNTVIARRHGTWFDEPIVYTGRQCTDGATIAGFVIAALRDRAVVHIDLFGVGAQPYGHLMRTQQQVVGVNVGDPAGGVTRDGSIRFKNLRSELWWRMREALDPNSNSGIALPPDSRLLADLCAPTWELRGGVIYVQGRDAIVKAIGRSPDYGSAYALGLLDTMKRRTAHALLRGPAREYDPFRDI